jgi:phage-related protein
MLLKQHWSVIDVIKQYWSEIDVVIKQYWSVIDVVKATLMCNWCYKEILKCNW